MAFLLFSKNVKNYFLNKGIYFLKDSRDIANAVGELWPWSFKTNHFKWGRQPEDTIQTALKPLLSHTCEGNVNKILLAYLLVS